MATLNSVTTRLNAGSVNTRALFTALQKMALIDSVPDTQSLLTPTEYNDVAFLNIENAFYLLKNNINYLVKISGQYKLVDLMGDKPAGVSFFSINESGISAVLNSYEDKLDEFETTINKLTEIFKLNGFMEDK